MNVVEFLWKGFGALTALRPPSKQEHEAIMKWMWAVAGWIVGIIFILFGSLAWAQGWVPGVSGVALKQDVADVNKQMISVSEAVRSIRLAQIKSQIADALVNSCIARERRNQDALNRANDDLYGRNGSQGLLEQYRILSGSQYPVPPSCNEILIAPDPTR